MHHDLYCKVKGVGMQGFHPYPHNWTNKGYYTTITFSSAGLWPLIPSRRILDIVGCHHAGGIGNRFLDIWLRQER